LGAAYVRGYTWTITGFNGLNVATVKCKQKSEGYKGKAENNSLFHTQLTRTTYIVYVHIIFARTIRVKFGVALIADAT
jgi:hypothetical protein